MTVSTPSAAVTDTLTNMTTAGVEFMTLVGNRHFDFFDDGIVIHGGNWGPNMASQAASAMGKTRRSMGGIMARLADAELGLWTVTNQESGIGNKVEAWWSLTQLGADVANFLAASYAEPELADDEAVTEAPAVVTSGKLRAHEGCSHVATKAARAACRRAAAKGVAPVVVTAATEAAIQLVIDSPSEDAADDEALIQLMLDTDDELDTFDDELDGNAYADAVLASL